MFIESRMKSFLIKDILNLKSRENCDSSKQWQQEKVPVESSTPMNIEQKDLPSIQKRSEETDNEPTSKGWRKKFTNVQRVSLEESFKSQRYLSIKQRNKLAKEICLSPEQVKTWYQNRRTRWKRNQISKLNNMYCWNTVAAYYNRDSQNHVPMDHMQVRSCKGTRDFKAKSSDKAFDYLRWY